MDRLLQLVAVRKARGLSQLELGRLAGLSQPYISDLELGRRPMERAHVLRLAAVLEVEPATLSASEVRVTITSPSGVVTVNA